MYPPACSIQRLAELQNPGTVRHQAERASQWGHQLQVPGTGRDEAGGIWWAVFGGRNVACDVLQIAGGIG